MGFLLSAYFLLATFAVIAMAILYPFLSLPASKPPSYPTQPSSGLLIQPNLRNGYFHDRCFVGRRLLEYETIGNR
jgi:hypothetical protein